MATMGRKLILYLSVCAAVLLLAGCVLPRTSEAPLISSANPTRNVNISEGQTESFRIEKDGATPEYSIYAASVINLTALFVINPGDIVVGIGEGQAKTVDFDRDGAPDVVIVLKNTTGSMAYLTITLAGAAQVCTTYCPTGQLQNPYPDCSCYSPAQQCATNCSGNQSQRPYPDCSCFTPTQFCSDNTAYGACSLTKPKYCDSGTLVNRCATCGCQSGTSCNSVSGACSVSASPTPGASPTATPTAPPADVAAQAVAAANATTEGSLIARYDSLYKKNMNCGQDEFKAMFQSRNGRAPTPTELGGYSSTKNYLPTGVSVAATLNAGNYDVLYSATGGHMPGPMLKVTVAPPSSVISSVWQGIYSSGCGGGSATECNTDLVSAAEAVSGNCGLVLKLNNW